MRKFLFILLVALCGCTGTKSNEPLDRAAANRYIETISGFTCEKAIVTADCYLAIGVDATSGNYDALARQFLDEAKREGVKGLKGCYVVDVKQARFSGDVVIGNRIGRAFN